MPPRTCTDLPCRPPRRQTRAAFNHAVRGYLAYRADAPARLRQLLAADPDFALGKSSRAISPCWPSTAPACRRPAMRWRRPGDCSADATRREQAHVAALAHWIDGDIDATLAAVGGDPRRASARRARLPPAPLPGLLVRPPRRDGARRPMPPTSAGARSSPAGRRCSPAAALRTRSWATTPSPRPPAARRSRWRPGDLWAAHGVAHVLEMQGRHDEGIAWLAAWSPTGRAATTSCIICGGTAGSIISSGASSTRCWPSTTATSAISPRRSRRRNPDIYIDVQNAASMLFRLERQGIDVGNRWSELADKAEARIGDCLSAFTLPHWMMALTAARPLGRCRAHASRACARSRRRGDGHGRAAGARLCAADRRGDRRARQGRSRARLRPDAAGARAACTASAAATRSRTCWSSCSSIAPCAPDARTTSARCLARVASRHPVYRRTGASAMLARVSNCSMG